MKTVESKKVQTPKLRHHKATGQAYVVLNGRAIYFGRYGTEEATESYHRSISEWLSCGKQTPAETSEITVAEILARFWNHAEEYYRHADGTVSREVINFRFAFRPLDKLYGHTKAVEFGPRCLRTVRQRIIDSGNSRGYVNQCVSRIKMVFKWAVGEELIPGSVHYALAAVSGLKKGRSEAKETEPVKPAAQEYVDAIQPFVSRQVWAIIQLQLLTGARPGEIVIMRPCDIDKSGKIWLYSPAEHKTAHHGHQRTIYIGPRGQEVLQPFLLRSAKAYCFSPTEAMAEWRQQMFANRKTPLLQGNRAGTNIKDTPKRTAGEHYTANSLAHTIARAIKNAFRPEGMSDKEFAKWKPQQHWHPHQLRHNAATYLRKEFGLETARIILGHRSAAITEVYAEMDQQKAMEAIVKVG